MKSARQMTAWREELAANSVGWIARDTMDLVGAVRVRIKEIGRTVRVRLPDGSEMDLPSTAQLFPCGQSAILLTTCKLIQESAGAVGIHPHEMFDLWCEATP